MATFSNATGVYGNDRSFEIDAWLTFLTTWQGQMTTAAVASVVVTLVVEILNPVGMRMVKKCQWWPRACEFQKDLSANFGYDREQMTEEQALDGYSWLILVCFWHLTTGVCALPVVFQGWHGAGKWCQLCFFLGTLCDLGFDLYDTMKKFLLTFQYPRFSSLGPPCPVKWFIVCCVFHHTLAMILMVPMNLKYPHLPEYSYIVASSLLAAGVCFLTGQYKFTLDCKVKNDFYQYKTIVVIQLVTVWVSRFFIWFYSAYNLLVKIYTLKDWTYFGLMCPLCLLFTLFNLVVLMDATMAAVKWLPRPAPAAGSKAGIKTKKN